MPPENAQPLVLRELTASDCEPLVTWVASEDELYQWSGPWDFTWPLTVEQLLSDLRAHGDPRFLFAVTGPGSDAAVGMVRLQIQRHHGLGLIGRVLLAPGHRGRGRGSALMSEVVRVAFDELELHRLALGVYAYNIAAIAAYERVGFVVEGEQRDSTRFSDGYRTGLTMALLAPDYRRARVPAAPGDEVVIRPARVGDRVAIARLLTQLGYPHDATAAGERLRAWAGESRGTVLVAELGPTVAGFIAVHAVRSFERPGAFARIVALSVDRDRRRTGTGRRLVAEAERWAARRGATAMEVTSRRRREDAHAFYASLGYEDESSRSGRFTRALVIPPA